MVTNTIPGMVVATFMLGLVTTPVFTAISSFGPFLTDDTRRLAKVNSWIEAASWTAFVVGPAMGAILAASIGVDSIFVLHAGTSLAAAALCWPVKIRSKSKHEAGVGGWSELRDGFRIAYGNPRLRFYIWLGSSVWLLFGIFSALEPLFYRDILGVEVETLGWVNSIFGIGLIGGTLIAIRLPERLRTATWLTILVGLNAVGVIAYVGTDILGVVVVAGFCWGLIIGQMAPLHRTMLQINSPDDALGRIMGVSHVHSEVGHLLPLAVAPALAAAVGVQQTLLASAAIVAICSVAFFVPARHLDRTRVVPVPRTGLPDPADEPKSLGH